MLRNHADVIAPELPALLRRDQSWRRRGIETTRGLSVLTTLEARRNNDGLTRQRPDAVITVAVF
jgi:hypothetical protein